MRTKLGVTIILALSVGWAQRAYDLRVDEFRVLKRAVELLQAKYGWQISYEDQPLSQAEYQTMGLNFSQHVQVALTGNETPKQAAQLLVNDDHQRGNHAAPFRVLTLGSMTVVASPQPTVLDLPVSLPTASRDLASIVDDLVAALNQAGPVRVHPGGWLRNGIQAHVVVGASHERARDFLARAFALWHTADPRHRLLYWFLLSGGDYGYVLNVNTVRQTGSSPDGSGIKTVEVQSIP